MNANLDFSILLLHQLEKATIVEIFCPTLTLKYFEGKIPIEYISNLINKADNDEKYFDTILLNYLVC